MFIFIQAVRYTNTIGPAPIIRGTHYQCYLPSYTGATEPWCSNCIGYGGGGGGGCSTRPFVTRINLVIKLSLLEYG